MYLVHVAIHLELRRKEKVQGFLDRFSAKLGCELSNVRVERYFKEPKHFRTTFDVPIAATDKERVVYQTLVVARTLESGHWLVNGPHEFEPIHFECFFDSSGDQPLKWGHVELLTVEE